jgi:hypothetical protein
MSYWSIESIHCTYQYYLIIISSLWDLWDLRFMPADPSVPRLRPGLYVGDYAHALYGPSTATDTLHMDMWLTCAMLIYACSAGSHWIACRASKAKSFDLSKQVKANFGLKSCFWTTYLWHQMRYELNSRRVTSGIQQIMGFLASPEFKKQTLYCVAWVGSFLRSLHQLS